MRTSMSRRLLILGLGLSTAYAAIAQEAALDEVVVTATKQGDGVGVQRIPAGISAVTGDTLEKANIRSLQDITRVVPSLQMGAASPGDLQPIIRGIQSPGAGTVGVYFDETVITGVNFQNGGGGTPDVGAYDIERVEVLKGPQGTLFGASSMSGTVRFISNKPSTQDWDARVSLSGAGVTDGSGNFGGDGMINIPLIPDKLGIRAVGWYDKRGGFIDEYTGIGAVTKIEDADEIEKSGGRIMARFTPTDSLTIDGFYMRQKYTDDGPQGYSDVPTGISKDINIIAGAPFLIGLTVPGVPGVAGDRVLTSPSQGSNHSNVSIYGGTITYDLPFGAIVATASNYQLNPYFFGWDTSGTVTRFGLVNFPAFFQSGDLFIDDPYRVEQTHVRNLQSSELRYSSKLAGPFNFVVGGYYQDENSDNNLLVVKSDRINGSTLCTLWDQCVANPASAAAQSILFATEQHYAINAYALFAHADYKILDNLTLGVGARYFSQNEHDINYTKQAFQGSIPFTLPPAAGGPVNTVPVVGLDTYIHENKPTWDASLGYQLTPDELLYVRAATGFRQGGANNIVTAQQLGVVIPARFEPDVVTSYEIGAKTAWLDHRLTLNTALFTMHWEDMQVPGEDATGVISFINNAAKAQVDGAEIELAARPIDALRLNFGITALDARLVEDQAAAGGPVGLDGNRIPKVPKVTLSGGAEYRLPAKIFNADTSLRTNFSYTGKSTTSFNDQFENNQPIGDYFLMNVSADFTYDHFQVRLFVNNVTDKSAVLDVFGQGDDPQQKITVEPRSYGAQIAWSLK